MKYVKLTIEDAQKLINYLVSKPWAEVNDLLSMIQRAAKTKEEPDGDRRLNDETGSSKSYSAGS